MTPQEESMLNDLIGRVEQTQLTEKDPEAEQLLAQRLGRNPNALYILAQTVLVQKYALEQATSQINQLRQQAQAPPQPTHSSSFLGNLLGHRDPTPPPPAAPLPPPRAPGLRRGSCTALCPALVAGASIRGASASASSRWRLKLPAHGRHHRRWCGCRSASLSGGRVVDARLWWW